MTLIMTLIMTLKNGFSYGYTDLRLCNLYINTQMNVTAIILFLNIMNTIKTITIINTIKPI